MEKLNKNNIILKEAIVKTIAFFDIFDFPLTDFEVWKFLYVGVETQNFASLRKVKNVLESNRIDDILENKDGFYFLQGRDEIIKIRQDRYIYTDRKFKKALRVMQVFKFIPWLKMAAVSNIMGAHNLRDGSDIDFFIITERKRVWLTRFFCVVLAKILRLRPRPGKTRDKICLNFYISEEAMDLKNLMLNSSIILSGAKNFVEENKLRDPCLPARFAIASARRAGRLHSVQDDKEVYDIYFIYWLAGLVPIYNNNSAYEKFIANNDWLKEYLPNWRMKNIAGRRLIKRDDFSFYRDIMDLLFGGLEKNFQSWQIKLMPAALKELKNIGRQVAINDQIIKMHANDRREEYRKRWIEKIRKFNI